MCRFEGPRNNNYFEAASSAIQGTVKLGSDYVLKGENPVGVR